MRYEIETAPFEVVILIEELEPKIAPFDGGETVLPLQLPDGLLGHR